MYVYVNESLYLTERLHTLSIWYLKMTYFFDFMLLINSLIHFYIVVFLLYSLFLTVLMISHWLIWAFHILRVLSFFCYTHSKCFLLLLLIVYGFDIKKFKMLSGQVYWLLVFFFDISLISFENGSFALLRIGQLFIYIFFQFISFLMGVFNLSRFYFEV